MLPVRARCHGDVGDADVWRVLRKQNVTGAHIWCNMQLPLDADVWSVLLFPPLMVKVRIGTEEDDPRSVLKGNLTTEPNISHKPLLCALQGKTPRRDACGQWRTLLTYGRTWRRPCPVCGGRRSVTGEQGARERPLWGSGLGSIPFKFNTIQEVHWNSNYFQCFQLQQCWIGIGFGLLPDWLELKWLTSYNHMFFILCSSSI